MAKVIEAPDPLPEGATPKEREKYRKDNERFLTEGFAHLPAERAKVDSTDARLKLLRNGHERWLEQRSPFKAAIWLALLRPAKQTIHDDVMLRRFIAAQERGDSVGDGPETTGIVALGNSLAAAALRGDTSAIAQIADRIEGKAALRAGDEAEDDPARRKQSQQITDDIIRRLTDKRLSEKEGPGGDAKVIDVEVQPATPKESNDGPTYENQ